jgi:hypothetical protein
MSTLRRRLSRIPRPTLRRRRSRRCLASTHRQSADHGPLVVLPSARQERCRSDASRRVPVRPGRVLCDQRRREGGDCARAHGEQPGVRLSAQAAGQVCVCRRDPLCARHVAEGDGDALRRHADALGPHRGDDSVHPRAYSARGRVSRAGRDCRSRHHREDCVQL